MLFIFLSPLILFILYRSYNLVNNYIAARQFNLPLIVLPTSLEEPLWILLRPFFGWVESLPFGLGKWYRYTDLGWPMQDGVETVERLGETFVLVTPTHNQIVSAYPGIAEHIHRDVKNWILPESFSQAFTFYGQNVSSLNGADWQRHRKITAPAFNDHTMRYVWEESVDRATKDLDFLLKGKATLADLRTDFSVLAMNVLLAVGFGQENTALTTIPPGHQLTLMDSLGFVLKNVFVSILFAGVKAPDFMLPPILRQLKLSVHEFRMYMEEAILRHMKTGKTSKPSLLQAMVSANEAEKNQKQATSGGKVPYLTNSELYGNLFVFNLAGYETTAGTMTFALPYLALHPEVQAWVIEEVDKYLVTPSSDYQETYPKLVRCMAFMYETLRMASPGTQMLRTPLVPTVVPIADKSSDPNIQTSITVPPNTYISGHFWAMHYSPRWGPDVNVFNPKRFVMTNAEGEEQLAMPADKGLSAMFLPWVFGARVWYVLNSPFPLRHDSFLCDSSFMVVGAFSLELIFPPSCAQSRQKVQSSRIRGRSGTNPLAIPYRSGH